MTRSDLDEFVDLAQQDPAEAARLLQTAVKHSFIPHEGGQRDILADRHRFQVLRAGRRWGKSEIAARRVVQHAMRPDQMIWWVSNRWRNTQRGYKKILRQLPPELLAKQAPSAASTGNLTLNLKNGSTIEFYSGENPGSLIGEGVNFVVMDEAALMKEDVWTQHVRPTLMDTGGHAMLVSTPRGRNWFWRLWHYGQDPARRQYMSWHFPQWTNPYVPQSETDDSKLELPSLVFEQEVAAEFVANAASIFTFDDAVIREEPVEPYGLVYMGVDVAKKEDWTVITASREDGEPCYHDRFQHLPWPVVRGRIADAVAELYSHDRVENVAVYLDAQGVGDVVIDELANDGVDVVGAGMTGPWKERAVYRLAADLERGKARILRAQVPEFESYEYEITDTGKYKFAAATGHDDEVSAKLLEHYGRTEESPIEAEALTELSEEVADDEPEEVPADTPEDIMQRPDAWTGMGESVSGRGFAGH